MDNFNWDISDILNTKPSVSEDSGTTHDERAADNMSMIISMRTVIDGVSPTAMGADVGDFNMSDIAGHEHYAHVGDLVIKVLGGEDEARKFFVNLSRLGQYAQYVSVMMAIPGESDTARLQALGSSGFLTRISHVAMAQSISKTLNFFSPSLEKLWPINKGGDDQNHG